MGHYSSAPRRGYVIIHHTGSPNSHLVTDGRWCSSGYDFTIDANGRIYVCKSNDGTFYRWTRNTGGAVWHASGCDCVSIGIMLHGCFGGCSSGNVSGPTYRQKCSAGYLLAHLRTPDEAARVRPHRNCRTWNPCRHPNPLTTVCPGSNFVGSTDWNSAGVALRDDIRYRRRQWDLYGCCQPPCPV